jgi:anhydro-N-acetylmuramic acid kinase
MENSRLIVGLMCGTSGDGVSAALVRTSGYLRERKTSVIAYKVEPYPVDLYQRLFKVFPPNLFPAEDLAYLQREFGILLGNVTLQIVKEAGLTPGDISAVIVQAPTLIHLRPEDGKMGVHIEIGEAAIIADMTGIPVMSDLRPSDVAAGGHGAPLSVYADYMLFADEKLGRAVQNIGGIANVTFVPANCQLKDLLSFDTGPGNMVIDGTVKFITHGAEKYDVDGIRAGRGKVSDELIQEMMKIPYLRLSPPKTSGREDFGDDFVTWFIGEAVKRNLSDDDMVATATAFTAKCIGFHYRKFLMPKSHLDEMILYGGGAHNKTLVKFLAKEIHPVKLRMHDEFSIHGDEREAVTWAILGDEAMAGYVTNVPAASGASHGVILGKLVCTNPGRGKWIAC